MKSLVCLEMSVPRGDFSFVKSSNEREMLADAYQAVTKADCWGLLSQANIPGDDGFMFSSHPGLRAIDSFIQYQGHTGASFGMTMRAMEFIAKFGWKEFVSNYQKSQGPFTATVCGCRAAQGFTSGWCGVAGGGVPACDH